MSAVTSEFISLSVVVERSALALDPSSSPATDRSVNQESDTMP
jgi:hypothetical protein